jgi:hypothetical protein
LRGIIIGFSGIGTTVLNELIAHSLSVIYANGKFLIGTAPALPSAVSVTHPDMRIVTATKRAANTLFVLLVYSTVTRSL